MERKLLTASSPFGAVRDGQFTMPRFVDVDLTTARTEQTALEIPIAGNVLYCDANPNDGACVIEFNDVGRDPGTDTPFYASPGFIANVPYTRIRVYNDAQPGKKIRIVYGVDIPFQPGSVGSLTLSQSQIDLLTRPLLPGSFWVSNAVLAANTPVTVFNAAANVNGAVIHYAEGTDFLTTNTLSSFIAKAGAAPANVADGEIVCLSEITAVGGSNWAHAKLGQATRIDAGKALYYIASSATAASNGLRMCRYTLL